MTTSADENVWNIKKTGFHKKEKFWLKGAVSMKKKWLLLKGMVLTKGNGFHETQRLSLKGMASTKRNDFHWNEWLPIKGIASNKGNAFH